MLLEMEDKKKRLNFERDFRLLLLDPFMKLLNMFRRNNKVEQSGKKVISEMFPNKLV